MEVTQDPKCTEWTTLKFISVFTNTTTGPYLEAAASNAYSLTHSLTHSPLPIYTEVFEQSVQVMKYQIKKQEYGSAWQQALQRTRNAYRIAGLSYPHETTLLPLHRFLWNLIFEHFSNTWRLDLSSIKIGQEYRILFMKTQYTFLIISRSFFLRMRNVSDKRCGANKHTFYVQ